jgi:transposase
MSKTNRRRFDSKFKTKVVIEALKEQETLSVLSKEFNLHPLQIMNWKKQALSGLPTLFEGGSVIKDSKPDPDIDSITAPLYEKIGRLEVEMDFLKKVHKKTFTPLNRPVLRTLTDLLVARLSIATQCELLSLPRATYYYQAVGESAENLALMRAIDELNMKYSFFG